MSPTFAFGDGLSHSEYEELASALGPELMAKVRSAERLGVPGRGDYPLFDDTCHAMELNAVVSVPEWDGQEVRAALEEDIVFTGGKVVFLDGRQTSLHLIR